MRTAARFASATPANLISHLQVLNSKQRVVLDKILLKDQAVMCIISLVHQFLELTLNLVWMMLAAFMAWLWLCHAPLKGTSRRTQLVALAVILLILLPVISVTDDLMAAQSPAETNSCQRRNVVCPHAHPAPAAVVIFSLPVFVDHALDPVGMALLNNSASLDLQARAWTALWNRPPPAA